MTEYESVCVLYDFAGFTHSFSSSYMGRMAGWQTNAKVRMGTAYTV